jgi:hypothetical protein
MIYMYFVTWLYYPYMLSIEFWNNILWNRTLCKINVEFIVGFVKHTRWFIMCWLRDVVVVNVVHVVAVGEAIADYKMHPSTTDLVAWYIECSTWGKDFVLWPIAFNMLHNLQWNQTNIKLYSAHLIRGTIREKAIYVWTCIWLIYPYMYGREYVIYIHICMDVYRACISIDVWTCIWLVYPHMYGHIYIACIPRDVWTCTWWYIYICMEVYMACFSIDVWTCIWIVYPWMCIWLVYT